MNLQLESVTMRQTRKDLRKQLLLATFGTALAIVTLAAIGAWSASSEAARGGAGRLLAQPAHRATFISRAHSPQLVTYYLVGSEEQADRWQSQMQQDPYVAPGGCLFVAVSTPEEELWVRWMITEAENIAGGERSIQVVDLRPNERGVGEAASVCNQAAPAPELGGSQSGVY